MRFLPLTVVVLWFAAIACACALDRGGLYNVFAAGPGPGGNGSGGVSEGGGPGSGGQGGLSTGGQGGGGAPQFEPTQLADCELWLRADMGVSTVGGNVDVWEDQAGPPNDATQVNTSQRPTHHPSYAPLNNQAAVECSPGHFMDMMLSSGAPDDFTVFAVFDLPSLSGATWLLGGGNVDIAPLTNGGDQVGYYTAAGWQHVAPPATGAQVLTWRLDSAEGLGRVWRNGVQVGTPQPYMSGMMNATFILGGHSAFTLTCAEMVVYERALSDGERVTVETYLRARYGL